MLVHCLEHLYNLRKVYDNIAFFSVSVARRCMAVLAAKFCILSLFIVQKAPTPTSVLFHSAVFHKSDIASLLQAHESTTETSIGILPKSTLFRHCEA
jgi:hypothetical protein